MNPFRITAPIVLLALGIPASQAGDEAPDGLRNLYQAAAARDGGIAGAGLDKAGPAEHAAAAPAPVHAVMRVKRMPGGSLGVVCATEPAPGRLDNPARDHGGARDRK